MSDIRLVKSAIQNGVWHGLLTGVKAEPLLEVWHQEAQLAGVSLTENPENPGEWAVKMPIPVELLSEGVQTFLIFDAPTGEKIGHFTIISGVAMEDDIRAEMDLLRAELDMLKRAFRRHCLETQ